MKSILAILLLLLLHGAAFACVNEDEQEGGVLLPIALHFAPRDFKAEASTLREKAERYLEMFGSSHEPRYKLVYSVT